LQNFELEIFFARRILRMGTDGGPNRDLGLRTRFESIQRHFIARWRYEDESGRKAQGKMAANTQPKAVVYLLDATFALPELSYCLTTCVTRAMASSR
jgi:hypothetical protein